MRLGRSINHIDIFCQRKALNSCSEILVDFISSKLWNLYNLLRKTFLESSLEKKLLKCFSSSTKVTVPFRIWIKFFKGVLHDRCDILKPRMLFQDRSLSFMSIILVSKSVERFP